VEGEAADRLAAGRSAAAARREAGDMKRHTESPYALPAFLAVSGGVLAVVVAVFSLRELVAPRTQVWTVWTTTALAMLGMLAIALWVTGAFIASRMHRARRDRVHTFLSGEERARVLDAVKQFENRTSGEIRVHLAEHSYGEPTLTAVRTFEKLGMTRTRDRNGVLIFVSVRDRRVAVIGDAGIHEKVQEVFWTGVVRSIERELVKGRHVEGLVKGIEMSGARLAEYFPHRADDRNELADSISDDT
jgi:uncharacterized membrane protein